MHKILLCNYSSGDRFVEAQKKNTESAKEIGGITSVIEYGPSDIDSSFKKKHRFIFEQKRGAGYWVWKFLCIINALTYECENGDYLLYCDSGSTFVSNVDKLVLQLDKVYTETKQPILCFANYGRKEREWTKMDTFLLMDALDPKYYETDQRLASFQLIRKCPEAISFYNDCLKYALDPKCITDLPNLLGSPNLPGFKDHRHDQSIFSIMTKKYGYKAFRDPSQYGNDIPLEGDYPQIFNQHRDSK